MVLEETLESSLDSKEIKPVNTKYSLKELMLKLKLQYFDHLMQRAHSLEKTLMLEKIEGRVGKGVAENEMVGWHYQLNRHESEQSPGVGDGQKSLACCSPRGRKESDTT